MVTKRFTLSRAKRCCLLLVALLFAPAMSQEWESLVAEADSLAAVRNVDSAMVVMERALAKHGAEWKASDLPFATSLFHLAAAAMNRSDYQKALSLIAPAISVYEQHSPPGDPMLARSLNVKGISYWGLGECGKARVVFEWALNIWEKSPMPDSMHLLKVLVNCASLANDQNRFAAARTLFQRALTICDKRPDLAPSFMRIINNNLNNLYLSLDEFARAADGFEKELATLESQPSPDSSLLAACLQNLASAYCGLRRFSEAADLLSRALKVEVACKGKSSGDAAAVLSKQAELDLDIGKYDEADSLCEESLDMLTKTYGPNHPVLVQPLRIQARYSHTVRDTRRAVPLLKRAFDIIHDDFVENCWVLTEIDALRHAATMRATANQYLTYFRLSGARDSETVRQAADVILAVKGQVSDEMFLRNRSLVRENDAQTRRLATELREGRRNLARMYNFGESVGNERPQVKAELDSLARLCDGLENQLALRSLSYREATSTRKVGAARVSSLLPPNSILIEYLRYGFNPRPEETSQPRYLALLLTADGFSRIVDLGACSSIDSLVASYRSVIADVAESWPDLGSELIRRSDSTLTDLYRSLWQPIAGGIDTGITVFVAPDGAVNLLSLAGLKDETGKYLIERYSLHYLSAGRDLLRLQHGHSSGSGLLALGDPDFHAGSALGSGHVTGSSEERKDVETFSALPYTRREVNGVADVWLGQNPGTCALLVGEEASEERFRREAPGKRVLHLATHGFFKTAHGDESFGEDFATPFADDRVLQNPLLNSGLYLAGAARRSLSTAEAETDDGILTAYEVADLDLSSADWVVLSACESGLGDVQAGEGVYGLRRAFQMAGARTVISSLWAIPDKETARMMRSLYSGRGSALANAMREMALHEITDNRAKGLPDHPYLWASFIAVGDWKQPR